MKVAIISATAREISEARESLTGKNLDDQSPLEVSFYETGVGILASCFAITKLIYEKKPDLIIQAGIAGSFNSNLSLGTVVTVEKEFLGDTGVEENLMFKDIFDLNLLENNTTPFFKNSLLNIGIDEYNLLQLQKVDAITINEVTTRQERIEQLAEKYNPTLESMEGASLHYCCLIKGISFIQIRAISNYVGERDKSKWNFTNSLHNISETVVAYIKALNNQLESKEEQ